MYKKELVIIALYPGMKEELQELCNVMQINPTIIEWDVAEYALITTLKKHFAEYGWPDVIISRGATANLIEQHLPEVASVRAEAEEISLLNSVKEATHYGSRIGILMFEEFVVNFNLEAAKRLLNLPDLKIYPFRTGEDIQKQVHQGLSDRMDAMIGTRMAHRTGNKIGLPVIPLNSGRLSIQKAIKQAISIIQARKREKMQLTSFNEAVSSIMEGILTIENGLVIVANKVACDIFRVAESNMLGKYIFDLSIVKLSEKLQNFFSEETNSEEILRIQNRNYYVKKSCLKTERTKRIVVVLRSTKEIQEQANLVRTELRNSGFVARYHFEDIIGSSEITRTLLDKANFYAVTDANILISGESGTGKELLAQSIHNASPRKNEPFVAVNCAAIPATLLESELFGYEEGAFSGAKKGGKPGLFELAHKGTIFLDEINSMPIELQSVLLRTLQEKEVRRVGSQKNIYVDIRVIAASNHSLLELIKNEKFRSDLYYRLNTLRLAIPALRERKEDIPELALHYIAHYSQTYGFFPPVLSDDDLAHLKNNAWAGNIRELSNVIHRFVILNQAQITPISECFDILEATVKGYEEKKSPPDYTASSKKLSEIERDIILDRLRKNNGNRQKTAEDLGIARSTLWKKLEEYQTQTP